MTKVEDGDNRDVTNIIKLVSDYARFVIGNSSKPTIFYSYKICKQCKQTYSSNLHSFNTRVSASGAVFLTKSKDANHHESHIVWPRHNVFSKRSVFYSCTL